MAIPLILFMTTHKPSNWTMDIKGEGQPDSHQDLPNLGPDLTAGISYTINLHVFFKTRLRPLVGPIKNALGAVPPSPHKRMGVVSPHLRDPPFLMLSGGCAPKIDQAHMVV